MDDAEAFEKFKQCAVEVLQVEPENPRALLGKQGGCRCAKSGGGARDDRRDSFKLHWMILSLSIANAHSLGRGYKISCRIHLMASRSHRVVLALDHRDLEPIARRKHRGGEPRHPGADDHEIIFLHQSPRHCRAQPVKTGVNALVTRQSIRFA